MLEKKWFFISFFSEGKSIFTGTDHFPVFRSEDKVLDPAGDNKPNVLQRLGIIYEDLKDEPGVDAVTEDILLEGIRESLFIEELTVTGNKINRKDLIEAIYTKDLVSQFLETSKLQSR